MPPHAPPPHARARPRTHALPSSPSDVRPAPRRPRLASLARSPTARLLRFASPPHVQGNPGRLPSLPAHTPHRLLRRPLRRRGGERRRRESGSARLALLPRDRCVLARRQRQQQLAPPPQGLASAASRNCRPLFPAAPDPTHSSHGGRRPLLSASLIGSLSLPTPPTDSGGAARAATQQPSLDAEPRLSLAAVPFVRRAAAGSAPHLNVSRGAARNHFHGPAVFPEPAAAAAAAAAASSIAASVAASAGAAERNPATVAGVGRLQPGLAKEEEEEKNRAGDQPPWAPHRRRRRCRCYRRRLRKMVLVHVGYLVLPVFSVRNRGISSLSCLFLASLASPGGRAGLGSVGSKGSCGRLP